MEQNFQTSFIPKKPLTEETRPVSSTRMSFLTVVSLLIFFAMLIGTGGLYFYKEMLKKNIVKMQNDLELAKNRFEPAKISQLELLNRRLEAAKAVLSEHMTISPIFEALQRSTMKSVRYTKFSYSSNAENGKVDVSLAGTAVGYRSIALQSDIFSEDKFFIDPIFSNLNLDTKGNVNFDLKFSVDPSKLNYEKSLELSGSQE